MACARFSEKARRSSRNKLALTEKWEGAFAPFLARRRRLRGRQTFKTLKKVCAAAVGSIEMKLWLTFSLEVSKCRAGVRLLIPHSVTRQCEEDWGPLWRSGDDSCHWNKCWTAHIWPRRMRLSSQASLNGAEKDECLKFPESPKTCPQCTVERAQVDVSEISTPMY